MLILGRSNDDKGTQLERLTYRLVEALGYTVTSANLVGTGGEEIDVLATRAIEELGRTRVERLLCECKAHAAPLALPDWLKFLGKVFTEELRRPGETRTAYLIALAGVNGNVAGHYDTISALRPNIQLVTADILRRQVRDVFGLCDQTQVEHVVRAATGQAIRRSELAYYDGAVYWAVLLEGDTLALLHSDGTPVRPEPRAALTPLLAGAMPGRVVVDLAEASRARDRASRAAKFVLSRILLAGGRTSPAAVREAAAAAGAAGVSPWAPGEAFTDADIGGALQEILDAGLVEVGGEGSGGDEGAEFLSLRHDNDPRERAAFYPVLASVDEFLLSSPVPTFVLDALWSEYHQSRVDEDYVAHVQRVQGGLPLEPNEIDEVRRVLAWSPAALAWAIQPDEFIVNALSGTGLDEEARASPRLRDVTRAVVRPYFFRELYERLADDCKRGPVARGLSERFGVRRCEVTTTVRVRGGAGVLFEGAATERLVYVQLDEAAFGVGEGLRFAITRAPDDGALEADERS